MISGPSYQPAPRARLQPLAPDGWLVGSLLVWLGLTLAAAIAAVAMGTLSPAAGSVALVTAVAPAVVSLALAPRFGETWAVVSAGLAWLVAACLAAGLSGGLLSPLIMAFAVAPALAFRAGRRDLAAELSLFGLLGLVLLAYPPALGMGSPVRAGPVEAGLAVSALLLAAALMFGPFREVTAVRGSQALIPEAVAVAMVNADGRITAATPMFAHRLGRAGQRLAGLHLADVGAAEGPGRAALRVALAVALRGRTGRARLRLAQPPGESQRTLEAELVPFGRGVAVSLYDVSAWVEQANKPPAADLPAVSPDPAPTRDTQYLAEVTHELRTPLTHILGFAEMIQLQPFGPVEPRYLEYAGLIRQSGAHLLDMVNRMLDLAKIEAGRFPLELEQFDLRDLVTECQRQFATAAETASVTLEVDVPTEPVPITADAAAVRQILTNLCANALKFTPAGGYVVIRLVAQASQVAIEVEDSGPGITDADKARLGRPYEQTAAASGKGGTGLGLALVRAMAELHGGSLGFADGALGGAQVRVVLPRTAKAP